ncbi:anti-sigma factor [Microlunatus sp. Y2014]|uniref:anti-sigma factor n=1 Tax=Microlunatus sp. Y2014 TaxID=3418488 RepID=UPI003DA6E24B
MSDIHDDAAAYAVDALDEADRADFERHLANCEECRRTVEVMREDLSELAGLQETPPPPEVRSAVLGAIASPDASEPDTASAPAGRTPRGRSTRTAWLVAAAALVVALALGGWVVQLQVRQAEVRQADESMAALLGAPDLTVHQVSLAGVPGSYLVSTGQNRGVFIARDVPQPGADRSYQLWAITGGRPTSVGLVDHGGTLRVWFDGVADAEQLAITIEPAGGSPEPTTEPLAVATL